MATRDRDSELFIGGPRDGTRMVVPQSLSVVVVPSVVPDRNTPLPEDWFTRHVTPRYETTCYLREHMAVMGLMLSFWKWEGVTLEEAMVMLFEGYRKKG
jgi:hypothetical protein